MNGQKLQLKVDRARWWLANHHPFYAQLSMALRDEFRPVPTGTAGTDGRRIIWTPEFLAGLSDEETRGVLLHETLHCAHLHHWRLPLDARGQIAGDLEINLTIQDIPELALPAGGLRDPQYRNLACEEILARLPEYEDGEGDPGGTGSFLEPDETESQSQNDPGGITEPLRDEWEERLVAAKLAQEAVRGDTPSDMTRILDRITAQRIDWRQEMSEFVRTVVGHRNDWSRPARRHAWQPVIYPRRRADELGTVIFARDTSGSISPELCAEFTALISQATAETGCGAVVLDCDAAVQGEQRLLPGEMPDLEAHGGGGTDFCPVFNRAREIQDEGERIAGLVYLTDMFGTFPDQAPEYPVLWIASSPEIAPFGRTVQAL